MWWLRWQLYWARHARRDAALDLEAAQRDVARAEWAISYYASRAVAIDRQLSVEKTIRRSRKR